MYFKDIELINVDNLINSKHNIFAHLCDEEYETLADHIKLSIKYFYRIFESKQLDRAFAKLEKILLEGIDKKSILLFREMLINTIVLHDIGKINARFQISKLGNKLSIKGIDNLNYSDHSLLSSVIYMNEYYDRIDCLDENIKYFFFNIMLMNAYVISRHHGDLSSMDEFKGQFDDRIDLSNGFRLFNERKPLYVDMLNKKLTILAEDIYDLFYFVDAFKENLNKDILLYCYIYERLILSLLYACDYYATAEFMSKIETNEFGTIADIDEFYNLFKETEKYKAIRAYEKDRYNKKQDLSNIENINTLRNELFLDAEKTLLDNLNADVFYLEAPTGSGKSNTAFNLSFKLLEKDPSKNKIFYVYPFNTLVEQNIQTLKNLFENKEEVLNRIAVINSIEPVKLDINAFKDQENISLEYYKKALLDRQFLNYPIVLTTHVTLFSYLFSTIKEQIFPLHQLANSVIVIDEIQSYRNVIWGEIITFLTSYAKILNIKIIIMSATMPDLDLLSLIEGSTVKLIADREKYFCNPKFKNRVCVDFSLLDSQDVIKDLYNHIKSRSFENKKILIEFISKNTAYMFYKLLSEVEDIPSIKLLMTGDDNIAERERILNIIKENKNKNGIILVATQVVEAGVDIDMDYGYKDISLFDSEEQFLGRINRSCLKTGYAYFFNFDKTTDVYKDDLRVEEGLTLSDKKIREILGNKNFTDYYSKVIKRLKIFTNKNNKYNIDIFINNSVRKLNFLEIQNHMKLISSDNSKISLFLSSQQDIKGTIVDGNEVWIEYKNLLENNKMDYSEKRVKLSQVRSKMNSFIYEIKWKLDFSYNDRIGDLYYIEDGEKYFVNGKLDKDIFKKGIGDFI